MKKKIIFLVVIVIVGLFFFFFKEQQTVQKYNEVQPFLSLQLNDISRIYIGQGMDSTELILKDSVWTLKEGIVANERKVQDLLKRLVKLSVREVVSERDLDLKRYVLDSNRRKEVRIYNKQSKMVLHVLVGRFSSFSLNGSYWKKPSNSKIYRCCGNITYDIEPFSRKWKNLNSTFFPVGKVTQVKVSWVDKSKKKVNNFKFKSNKWSLNGNQKVDSLKIENMIRKLNIFQADDIVTLDKKDKKDIEIMVVLESGKKEEYKGFSDEEYIYFTYSKELSSFWYQIPKYVFKEIFLPLKDFNKINKKAKK